MTDVVDKSWKCHVRLSFCLSDCQRDKDRKGRTTKALCWASHSAAAAPPPSSQGDKMSPPPLLSPQTPGFSTARSLSRGDASIPRRPEFAELEQGRFVHAAPPDTPRVPSVLPQTAPAEQLGNSTLGRPGPVGRTDVQRRDWASFAHLRFKTHFVALQTCERCVWFSTLIKIPFCLIK